MILCSWTLHPVNGRAMNGVQLFEGGKQQRKNLFFHLTNTALNKVLHILSIDLSKTKFEVLLNAHSWVYITSAQISCSHSYLCKLPFAVVQIVVWVSWCKVVFQMDWHYFIRNTILLSSSSCLFAVSCLLRHLMLLKSSSVTLPKAVLAWIVCIILASHRKPKLFGPLFSGTLHFNFIF